MTNSEVWVVTGASRGIGTEFVKQILSLHNSQVIAGARSPEKTPALQDLKQQHADRLHLLTLDVTDLASVQGAAKLVSQLPGITGLDYLINNAGASDPGQSRHDTLKPSDDTATELAKAMTSTHSECLLKSGQKKTVVNVSSGSGSLSKRYDEFTNRHDKESKHLPTSLGYKTSKAALNMLTIAWASDVTPEEGFTFVAMHPGVVNTDMTTASMRALKYDEAAIAACLTPAKAVEQLMSTITQLTTENSGQFLSPDGKPITF